MVAAAIEGGNVLLFFVVVVVVVCLFKVPPFIFWLACLHASMVRLFKTRQAVTISRPPSTYQAGG